MVCLGCGVYCWVHPGVLVYPGVHVPFISGFLGLHIGPRVGMQIVGFVPLDSFFFFSVIWN